ncbi:major facilitator superfamily domain-containing protein [Lipomyces kononenkoae]|uniref:Major facilitator superfamily domain-containing protein n=1 Tax=Lipomyces kononenkoae TaxID=34357 RepID=A0ACC3SS84_LIPKO
MPGVRTSGGNAAFHNFVNDFAHISDPYERRRMALAKIDNAPFGWYHVRAIMVAGIGFFTDAYDIFSINIVVVMLGYVYFHGSGSKLPTNSDTTLKVATSGGTVVGQLGFGWLADMIGRKRIYGIELIIIIVGTLGQALSGPSQAINIIGILTFWRVIMGIGIGGDYPLSSIITSEFATTKWRGAIMGAVFANQGWGQLAAAIVALCATAGFKNTLSAAHTASQCLNNCQTAIDQMWRITIGFGAVPACIALYYRLTIPETPRFTFDVSRELEKGAADIQTYVSGVYGNANQEEIMEIREAEKRPARLDLPKASWHDFWAHFSQWKYGKVLIGTAGSWLLLDIAFYGLGLNNSAILAAIGYAGQTNVYTNIYNTCVGNLILICAGGIPGYWFSVATIDIIGRKTLQIAGFGMLTILFCIIGFAYHVIGGHGLLALYTLSQLFLNWGPNTTTFVIPGECYPTRYRSTAHGISAASGKIGAIIAQTAIAPLRTRGCPGGNCWLNHVMEIFAVFMLTGFFVSFLVPETKRQTLEEICERVHDEANLSKASSPGSPGSTESTAGREKVVVAEV